MALPEFPWLNTISQVMVMLSSLHSPRLTPSPLDKRGLLLEAQGYFNVMKQRSNTLPPLGAASLAPRGGVMQRIRNF
jgi:hypothetical protein